jgi:hypothetical protein
MLFSGLNESEDEEGNHLCPFDNNTPNPNPVPNPEED